MLILHQMNWRHQFNVRESPLVVVARIGKAVRLTMLICPAQPTVCPSLRTVSIQTRLAGANNGCKQLCWMVCNPHLMRLGVRQQAMMLVAVCLEGDDDNCAKLKCSDGLQRHFCLEYLKLN